MQLRPMRCGEVHVGEDIGLGFVHERRKLRQPGSQPVGDLGPLRLGGLDKPLRLSAR